MTNIADAAYRYAFAIYVLFGSFAYYTFYSLGKFIAQHFVPENPSGFSIANPNFKTLNSVLAGVIALVIVVGLFAHQRLKEYVVDVGDELTRVSWSELSETQRSTLTVIGLVIVTSFFLFFVDLVVLKIVNLFLGLAA